MQDSDYFLTSQEIHDKYPKGSPDYPDHRSHCPCASCYESWSNYYQAQSGIRFSRKHLLKSSGSDIIPGVLPSSWLRAWVPERQRVLPNMVP